MQTMASPSRIPARYRAARHPAAARWPRRHRSRLALLALLAFGAGRALAQQLPVPAAGLPGYVTGAQEVPDPGLVYKVVFDVASTAPADKVHPNLIRAARYLNTLSEYGVPPIRRQLTIVLREGAAVCALKDAAFAARNHGHSNPNTALIAALQQAGVSVRVDGQSLLEQHINPGDLLPAVQVDLSALSTLINLQLHGYVAMGE